MSDAASRADVDPRSAWDGNRERNHRGDVHMSVMAGMGKRRTISDGRENLWFSVRGRLRARRTR